MHRLLLSAAICSSLMIGNALAAEHDHQHEHSSSLAPHVHGVANLNIALVHNSFELELNGPAINIVGFEYVPTTDNDKATAIAAKQQLDNPLTLFAIPSAAKCSITLKKIDSPVFGDVHEHEEEHANEAEAHSHINVETFYSFTCSNIQALQQLDFSTFFKTFPNTNKIEVQYIGANGQQGTELTPEKSVFNLR